MGRASGSVNKKKEKYKGYLHCAITEKVKGEKVGRGGGGGGGEKKRSSRRRRSSSSGGNKKRTRVTVKYEMTRDILLFPSKAIRFEPRMRW